MLSIPVAFAQNGNIENDFQYSDYDAEVKTLINLGILQLFEDNTFRPEQKFTRAEAAADMIRLRGIEPMPVNSQTVFQWTDINENTQYAGEILQAYSSGIMVGESDTMFNPEGAVTGLQFGIILSRVLGYEPVAQTFGGYPQGYIKLISDLELLDGISINLNEPIKRSDAAVMIYNALDINLMEHAFPGSGDSLVVSDDETILSKYLGLVKGEAMIKANSCTNLERDLDLGEGQILLGDIIVDEGVTNASEYIGYYVTYYLDEETETLKYLTPKKNKNEIKIINAENLALEAVDAEIQNLYYYENNRIKRHSLDKNFDVLYNGCVWDDFKASDFNIKNGQIKLLDNNSDRKFDLVFIEEYEDLIITGVDKVAEVIYAEEGKKIEYQNAEKIDIYDKNGVIVNINTLTKDTVLSAYVSKEGNYVRAYTSIDFIEGVVSNRTISDDDKKIIKIDNDYYTASISDDAFNAVRIGNSVKLVLNAFGYVVKVETVSAGDFHYGYIFKARKNVDDETQGIIKLMDATTGKYETLQFAEKVSVNGKRRNDANEKYNFDLIFDEFLSRNGEVTPKLIRFELNDEGKIYKLYTDAGTENIFDKECLVKAYSGNILYWQSGSTWRLGSSYRLGGDTITMFLPPADENGEYNPDFVRFSSTIYHNHNYNVEIYDVDENYIPRIVVFKNDSTSLGDTRFNVLVEGFSETVYDDEPYRAIKGWQNGKEIKLIVSENVSLDGITPGMVIEVNKNGYGLVTGITKVFDLETGRAINRPVNSGAMMDFYLYFYGTVCNKGTDSLMIDYADGNPTDVVTVQFGQGNVYMYDKSAGRNKISVASEKDAIEGVSKVLVRFSDGVTRDIFIVKE